MAGTEKQREEINRKLVSSQMKMIGLTYQHAMNTPEFWRVFTLTTEQTLEWRKDALSLIKKTFKCNKKRAELTLGMFELNLGLRIDDVSPNIVYIEGIDPYAYSDLESHSPHIKLTLFQKLKQFFKL